MRSQCAYTEEEVVDVGFIVDLERKKESFVLRGRELGLSGLVK